MMCVELHIQEQKETPCEGCEHRRPMLMAENRIAWHLWRHVQTQLRTTFSGVVGLDYTAVFLVARVLGITMDEAILTKLHALEAILIEEVNTHGHERDIRSD